MDTAFIHAIAAVAKRRLKNQDFMHLDSDAASDQQSHEVKKWFDQLSWPARFTTVKLLKS